LQFHKVRVTGTFVHSLEIFVGPRLHRINPSAEHGEPGYFVVTPLQRKEGYHCFLLQLPVCIFVGLFCRPLIYINRGWIPAAKRARESRPETMVNGEVTVAGLLRPGEKEGFFSPKINTNTNIWPWIDVGTMSRMFGGQPVLIDAEKGEQGQLPIGGLTVTELPNSHLSYTITWFSLSAISTALCLILRKRVLRRTA
jgi:surfeit locus 1 family protein